MTFHVTSFHGMPLQSIKIPLILNPTIADHTAPQYSQLRLQLLQHWEQTTQDILIGTDLLGQLQSHVGERTNFSGVKPGK